MAKIVEQWDQTNDGRAIEQLEELLVRRIRIWRPDVVLTNRANPRGQAPLSHIVNQVTLRAIESAADPTRFSENNRWMPNFYNRRSFNQIQVWLLPAFFWLCCQSSGRSQALKIICYGLTALWWVMLFFSHGRGIGVAMLISTVGIALLFRNQARALLKPALITFVLGIILYSLMFMAPPYLLAGDSTNSYLRRIESMQSGGRLQLWASAWDIFLQHPLFGGGPQHFSFFEGKFGHAHNMTLNYLAELGLIGTVSIVLLVINGGWSMIRNTLKRCSEINLMLISEHRGGGL